MRICVGCLVARNIVCLRLECLLVTLCVGGLGGRLVGWLVGWLLLSVC